MTEHNPRDEIETRVAERTAELHRSEMELRQILDLAPQIVGVFGPNRERLYANRVFLDYVGFSFEKWRDPNGRRKYLQLWVAKNLPDFEINNIVPLPPL